MDDPQYVLSDLQSLLVSCKSIGLDINIKKCELLFCSEPDSAILSSLCDFAPGIQIVSKSELTLLGCPVFSEGLEDAFLEKLSVMKILFHNLLSLHSHIAYFLLRNCLSVPKILYFMRTSSLWCFPALLNQFDSQLRSCLESILNLPLDDVNWTLATLPTKFGGLGIRSLSDLCLPAFIASAYGAIDFVKSFHTFHGDKIEIYHLSEALQEWSVLNGNLSPTASLEIQKQWDLINITRIHNSLVTSSFSLVDKARLLAIQEREASAWLNAIPSSNIGTLMDNLSFSIAIALRLGCRFCQPHTCRCGTVVDELGHHGLSCLKSSGRISRHSALNDIIKRSLTSAGFPTILEPVGISRSDGKRPDGLTLIPWAKGRSLMWDATCVDTVAPSHIASTQKIAGAAAESAVQIKKRKYSHISNNYFFVAFAVETFGTWCADAKDLINRIGRLLQDLTNDSRATNFLRQRIGIAIQRGNAISVMGTFPAASNFDEIFYFLNYKSF